MTEPQETLLTETGDSPADCEARPATSRYREALACLAEAEVRFCLLRDRMEELDRQRDLDLLIHPADRRVAHAALARAGFAARRDRRLRGKTVYLCYNTGRFHVLDVHTGFFQNGIEYMNARLALSRLDRSGPVPSLAAEDAFLHLVLHNLVGKPTLQEKHVPRLRELQAGGLEDERWREQARRFGLESAIEPAVSHLEDLVADAAAWRRLARTVRRILLRRPANAVGAWRWAHADRFRLRRRAVVLALLGPDGSGKTSFADALEAALRSSPLRAGRVYMGCWGHDRLPMRQLRRLVPPQVSYTRLLLRRMGVRLAIAEEEARILAEERPGVVPLGFAALRYAIKSLLFHLALGIEMSVRYVNGIALSRRPIVVTDRYVYDLEFRQGKVPFAHGSRLRRIVYKLFPAPDGILYLTTPYDLVERRKPQLDRRQFETMDRVFRRVLGPYHPLELTSDAPPEAMVDRFLTAHWEQLLARCNRRA